jgi:hypothetical protein
MVPPLFRQYVVHHAVERNDAFSMVLKSTTGSGINSLFI